MSRRSQLTPHAVVANDQMRRGHRAVLATV